MDLPSHPRFLSLSITIMGKAISTLACINEHQHLHDGVRGFLHRGLLGSGFVRLVWRCLLEDKQKKISARLSSVWTSTTSNATIVPEQANPTNLLNLSKHYHILNNRPLGVEVNGFEDTPMESNVGHSPDILPTWLRNRELVLACALTNAFCICIDQWR